MVSATNSRSLSYATLDLFLLLDLFDIGAEFVRHSYRFLTVSGFLLAEALADAEFVY
jgi:hypothetical protein